MAFNSLLLNRANISSEKLKSRLISAYNASIARYSYVYIVLATIVALIGYGVLLLFPVLVVTGLVNAYNAAAPEAWDWQAIVIWLAVSLLSMFISYRSMQVRCSSPKGLNLSSEKAPELYKLIRQTEQHFKRPKIDSVVITGNYELNIIKNPRWPLPIWSRNVLVIGLPVMLCHSPESFSVLLTRRIGQFSKRNNFVTNWIYQLRSIWQQYLLAYRDQAVTGTEPLRLLLSVYTKIYNLASAVPSQLDDLKADSYAMELYNDEIVREMITADCVYRTYIQQQYWPAINKVADIKKGVNLAPFKQLGTSVRAFFTAEKIKVAVKLELARERSWLDESASLGARIHNIGHDFPLMKPLQGENAAVEYLGDSADSVVNLNDKLWATQRKRDPA